MDYIGIVLKDGTMIVREVVTIQAVLGVWRVTAATALPSINLSDIKRIARARIMRFDADAMQETWATDDVMTTRLGFIENSLNQRRRARSIYLDLDARIFRFERRGDLLILHHGQSRIPDQFAFAFGAFFELVFAVIGVAYQMADICDIHHPFWSKATQFQCAHEHVVANERKPITDVRSIIDSWTAGVD